MRRFPLQQSITIIPGCKCLVLWCIFMLKTMQGMAHSLPAADTVPPVLLTVANIREVPEGHQVVFLESARFYTLPKTNKNNKKILALLRKSKATNKPAKAYMTVQHGDIIADVQPAKQ
jgi:hypothetical protein